MSGDPSGARRVLVSSVVRRAGHRTASGFVRVVDLVERRVVMKSAVPESERRRHDPNPRGGLRGARGVAVAGNRTLVANAERVLVFDRSWDLVADLGHPLAGGIHDVAPDDEGLWIAATSADLALRLDWEGNPVDSWEWRSEPAVRRELGFPWLPKVDRGRDYRDPESMRRGVPNVAHLNSVQVSECGLLVGLGRVARPSRYARLVLAGLAGGMAQRLRLPARPPGPRSGARPVSGLPGSTFAAVLVRPGGVPEVLWTQAGVEVPNHNAILLGGALVYLDSNRGDVVSVSRGAASERRVPVAGEGGFLRGLCPRSDGLLLVGDQRPLRLHCVDVEGAAVIDVLELGGEPEESVYGICSLPDAVDDPPEHL